MFSGYSQRLRVAQRRASSLMLAVAVTAMGIASSQAADYPDRAVKIIVPFAAGGTADAVPRIVADWLSRKWSQPVIIENRTGAAGNIGADFAYHSAPDGYTLLSSPPPPLVINQNLYPNLTFDPARFEPFNVMAQVKMRFIPYRGSAPALQGLLAANVDLMFDNLGVSLPLAEAGSLKLLAVASAARLPSLPEVPTIAETLPGFEAVAWYAIVAPPGTAKAITEKVNADVNECLRDPEIRERLKKLSAEVYGGSAEKAANYMRQEVERWGDVIKKANIKLE